MFVHAEKCCKERSSIDNDVRRRKRKEKEKERLLHHRHYKFINDIFLLFFYHLFGKKMLTTLSTITAIFSTLLLFASSQSSQKYTYSCNASAACGCSSSPAFVTRIVGGESALTNTWNWAVSISINSISLCGGVILSSSWIVTAAHCMINESISGVIVYAGSNTRFSGQARIASSIIIHPSYSSTTHRNDIALIQLSTPLTMTSAVKTICMPSVSSASLSAGEWPPANLYVCYYIILLLACQ